MWLRVSLEFISTFDFKPSMDITPGLLAALEARPTFMDQIGSRQREDSKLMDVMDRISR